jgi:hypothetical protein
MLDQLLKSFAVLTEIESGAEESRIRIGWRKKVEDKNHEEEDEESVPVAIEDRTTMPASQVSSTTASRTGPSQ